MSNQKPPTFQPKKQPMNRMRTSPQYSQNSALSENHQEVAAFLSRQWKKVQESLEKTKGEVAYEIYIEKETNKKPVDFQAFDLDKFWQQQALKSVIGKPSS